MRFINCPNCLSSHPDELERQSTNNAGRSVNHTKRSRLHNLTKALFSPVRSSSSLSGTTNKSNPNHLQNIQPNHLNNNVSNNERRFFKNQTTPVKQSVFYPKYQIERKHKIKKRDLVKQFRLTDHSTGNFCLYCDYFQLLFLLLLLVILNEFSVRHFWQLTVICC